MERIIDISHRHKSAHLSSSLTTFPILDHIYSHKKADDIVILSAGHAGLAQYVALEKHEGKNAEELFVKHGIHPHRDVQNGIHVSTGSLGSGITVAIGYAVANPLRNVYVILTDGECAEGSVWEALAFAQKKNLVNLKVHVNVNGFAAYEVVDWFSLWLRLKTFWWRTHIWFTNSPRIPCMKGLQAHYHVLSDENKDELIHYINEERICTKVVRRYEERFKSFFNYGRSWIRYFGFNP